MLVDDASLGKVDKILQPEERYRYQYQGQFAERDEETGWNHFELREYDPVIGRWTRTDPMEQYWSSYLAMGNEPVGTIDPDGGYSKFGAWWRNIVQGGYGIYPNGMDGNKAVWGFNTDEGAHFGEDAGSSLRLLQLAILRNSPPAPAKFDWQQTKYTNDGRFVVPPSMPDKDEQDFGFAMGDGPGSIGRIGQVAKVIRISRFARSLKMTLPAWKKVNIDIVHIASGHMVGGSRVSPLKTLFAQGMSQKQVLRLVRDAYRNCHTKLQTQGERILLRGESNGQTIEMWLNTTTKTIETAYPVP